jgi:Tfp pilus assembly protein PilF
MFVPAKRGMRFFSSLSSFALVVAGAHGQSFTIPASAPDAAALREAVALAQHGDERRALALVDEALERHPSAVLTLKLEAMLLEDLGRDEEAESAYEKALLVSPNDPELLLKVGTADLVKRRVAEAVPLLQRRTRLVAKDADGNYYLAQAYHLQGHPELALAAIRKALAAEPNNPAVQQKLGELLCSAGQYADAIPWLKKAQGADPTLGRINFDLAVATYDNMDLDAAADFATRQAQQQPSDLDNLLLLASIETKLGRWQEAETNLHRVLAARPEDAQALLALGHCQLELKDAAAAIATLQRSLAIDPTQVLAHYLLSRAYLLSGNAADAEHEAGLHREMMQHIAVAMPQSVARQGADLTDQARKLLEAGQEPAALHLFESSMKGAYVTRGSASMFVGATYLSLGDTQNAERMLRQALRLDPKTHGANTYLGVLALQQADLAQAESDFSAELALDPNQPLALAEMGEVRYRQGRWADAVDLLTRSKTSVPSLLYLLCDAEFREGKSQDADLTAETLMALSKGDPAIRAALRSLLLTNGQAALAARLSSTL